MDFRKKTLTALLTGICLFSFSLDAQDQGMTIEDVNQMKRVISTAISDDGNYIAYQVTDPPDPLKSNSHSSLNLYVYNTNTEESVAYYTDGSVSDVTFRPGHKSITFTTRQDEEKKNAIYEMPLTGGGAKKIYQFKSNIREYNWGSNGNKLVFTAKKPADKKEPKLPYKPEIFEEGLVNAKAYIANLSNEKPEAKMLKVDGTVYTAKWSPENDRIAISVAPTPLVDDYYMKKDVKVVSADTREVIADLNHKGKLADIQWSPEGDQLALLAGNSIHDVIAGRIMVADADGGDTKNILPDFKGKFEQIKWTGSNTIHFIASESTATGFGTVKPDGSNFKYELEPGNMIYQSFAFADNKHIAFVVTKPKHPRELYFKSGSGSPERITHSNPSFKNIKFGKQEVVTYEARDGLKIEGLLIKPVGYEPGDEVPLIVVAHGGPEAHHSNGWLTRYIYPGQVGAAKGYAVFYPNYRGSTGRGIEFLKSSQGDAAGKEFDDIVDGVDYLIEQGIADPDKVGITGGSYGGYATGWMATRYSDRFAAGVMNFGISDNISKWGTTDIPMEMYLVHAREWLWEGNWMKYLKRSPIYHVDKAQTPLLITHGKEDTRVHPSQSMELYRHIKVRKPDVPVRLVRYPGAGHGYGRAATQYDYHIRMMRWFDHFLMEDNEKKPSKSVNDWVEN